MLLLSGTSDVVQIVSSSTSALDVAASHVLKNGSTPTPGRTLTAITTATTTTVVAAPGSGSFTTVKTLIVRNKGATTNIVTVRMFDGSNNYEIMEAVLAADYSLQYHENAGWWVTDQQGREVTVKVENAGSPVTDADSIVMLSGDVTNNNGTANTIQDVTGLSFPVLANKLYWFEFNIVYTAAATTTGSRWTINGPASPTYLDYSSEYSLTTTTTTRNALLQAYDVPAASNASSATTGNNWARIYGVIQPTGSGTVIARFASEVLSSAIVAKIGSYVRYRQITP